MTSTSALLWARSNELGPVRLFVWPCAAQGDAVRPDQPEARGRPRPRRPAPRPRAEAGDALHLLFSTPYRKTEIASGGTFWTAPAAGTGATVRFAISGDADGARDRAPGSRASTASRSTAGWRPSGTTSTSTSATRSTRTASSAASARAHGPGEVGEVPAEPRLREPARPPRAAPGSTATGTTTSSSTTSRCPSTARRSTAPASRRSPTTRRSPGRPATASTAGSAGASTSSSSSSTSARSAAAKVRAICGNDLAPTAPPAVRDAFAALVPSLATPVPQACLDAHRGPVADDARRPPVRGVHEGDRGSTRDLEGGRQRGADPAVLRAALRPLGGLRGRA